MNNQSIDVIEKRDIDRILFSITIISQSIFYNDGKGYIYKRNINILIGCTINGVRKYITTIFEDEYTKTSDWYDLFLKLKNKNLEYAFFIVSDNEIINKAFKLAFKDAKSFYCFFNDIYRLYHYITSSYTNNVLNRCKNICLSKTIEEFNLKKQELCEEYSEYSFISDILSNSFKNYTTYFNYSLYLRKHLLSFYFIRDFKKKIITLSNSKPYFYTINEFAELLLPTIQRFETRMYCSKEDWNKVISIIYTDNKDLLLCVL